MWKNRGSNARLSTALITAHSYNMDNNLLMLYRDTNVCESSTTFYGIRTAQTKLKMLVIHLYKCKTFVVYEIVHLISKYLINKTK